MKVNTFYKLFRKGAAYAVSFLFALLLGGYLSQFLPTVYVGGYQIEVLIVVVVVFGVILLLHRYCGWRWLWLGCLVVGLVLFGLGFRRGNYTVGSVYHSYRVALRRSSSGHKKSFVGDRFYQKPHISLKQRLAKKVNSTDEEVRTFAVSHSLDFFDEYYAKYGQICRQFSVFKYIRNNYRYVKDPTVFDYFASPNETMYTMAGDCDDYTILMCSSLGAIGARCRMILTKGHVYPELCCGSPDDFESYRSAINTLFYEEVADKNINLRLSKEGEVWLNLDYTDRYPGSRYMNDTIVDIIYLDKGRK